jgi:phospholipid/cholesterol/gamma-HCH transport system substrate-binding protein
LSAPEERTIAMIFGKTKLEFKVGLFVFVGIILLGVFVLSIGGFKTWTSGYRISFIFDFVNGVKRGAPVRFAGVDIGVVKDLQFYFEPQENKTKIKVLCWLKKDARIPADSTIWVNTLGLLGEKYVEIMPGKDYTTLYAQGLEFRGVDPLAMHEIMRMANDIASDFKVTMDKIRSGEGTVGKLLMDDSIYQNLEYMSADLRSNPWKLLFKGKEKPPYKKPEATTKQ